MKEKYQLTFTQKYKKLDPMKILFTTVRWLDAHYVLGKIYNVIYIVPNAFHTQIKLGTARIVRMEIETVSQLSDLFIREDADCNRDEFYIKLERWYKRKPDWKGWDSEVQILHCFRVSTEKASAILDQEKCANSQTQLVSSRTG